MVEGVWGLCGPGRRGHTLLPRMRTFCRGGGGAGGVQGRGVSGRQGAVCPEEKQVWSGGALGCGRDCIFQYQHPCGFIAQACS